MHGDDDVGYSIPIFCTNEYITCYGRKLHGSTPHISLKEPSGNEWICELDAELVSQVKYALYVIIVQVLRGVARSTLGLVSA